MAPGPELPFRVKRFIVERLAQHEGPTAVAKAVKELFGLEVSKQRVAYYDPTTSAGAALSPELTQRFHETRKAFLEDIEAIPIANRAVRLRALQKQLEFYQDRQAAPIVRELVEAAAKEVGGAFTNEHKIKHGGSIGVRDEGIAGLTDDELERIAGGGRGRAAEAKASTH